MGRVYLCLGQNAELPYYFEKAKVHIWNIEELCYFIRENAWIMEPELLTKRTDRLGCAAVRFAKACGAVK